MFSTRGKEKHVYGEIIWGRGISPFLSKNTTVTGLFKKISKLMTF